MYQSQGIIQFGIFPRCVVNIDPQIAAYYCSLIPKAIKINGTKYPPHITVSRTGRDNPTANFGIADGQSISFYYSPIIQCDDRYWWLNIYSLELEALRISLGLDIEERFSVPPAGFNKVFHCTIGNTKV